MSDRIKPFQYRLAQVGNQHMPGAHLGKMSGLGQLFKRHDSLLANPDPRRLDLRASVLNPFKEYRVKVFQQASQISVYVVADLSASMRYQGTVAKQQTLSDFLLSAAYSAVQAGDRFNYIGCGRQLSPTATRLNIGVSTALAKQITTAKLQGSADSLLNIRRLLPNKRALVFLVSDFHMPLAKIQTVMAQLPGHTVVPVVLWDDAEYLNLPKWGIWKVQDLENQTTRTLFLRPAYKQKIIIAFQQRQRDLQQLFRSFAAEPLFINGAFRAELVSGYFYGRPV